MTETESSHALDEPSQTLALKRRILRETVDDNVALIQGVRRSRRATRRHGVPSPGHWIAWSLLLPAIVTAAFALTRPEPPEPGGPDEGEAKPRTLALEPESDARRDRPRWSAGAPLTVRAPERFDPAVFPLRVRHVVLDPGHGGEDHGTINGRLSEKELTLDIARRLANLLENRGFTVSMTRDRDRDLELRERRDFANRVEADIFVSIHINWIASRERGVETYFLGPAEDPQLAALARRENQSSGFALADQDSLIKSVILNAQHDRSRDLASDIQQSLYRSLRPINPELKDRGVKTAPFVVLVATEMPAILAEVSCLSNEEEAELLARPLYREHIAKALADGIRRYAAEINAPEAINVPEKKGTRGP